MILNTHKRVLRKHHLCTICKDSANCVYSVYCVIAFIALLRLIYNPLKSPLTKGDLANSEERIAFIALLCLLRLSNSK